MKERASRPDKVSTAMTLLWISLGIGVLRGIMEFSNSLAVATAQGFGSGYVIFVSLFTLAFMAFFFYMTGEGRNWARIVLLVLFVLGIPFSILPMIQSLMTNPVSGMLGIGQAILQLVALVFLFQEPSADWFKSAKK